MTSTTSDRGTVPRRIRCAFDVDPNGKAFTLIPLTSHLNQAVIDTREHASEIIREAVKETSAVVFAGSP